MMNGIYEYEGNARMSETVLTPEELVIIRSRTSADCAKIAKKDCDYCRYACGASGPGKQGSSSSVTTCNYIIMTGKRRPCLAGDCRKKGVFEKRIG